MVVSSPSLHPPFPALPLGSLFKGLFPWRSAAGVPRVLQQASAGAYGSVQLKLGFRADIVVEDKVVVEIKSVEAVAPVHKKQLLTYLRLMDRRLGLLINFNVVLIKNGITRVVNGLPE